MEILMSCEVAFPLHHPAARAPAKSRLLEWRVAVRCIGVSHTFSIRLSLPRGARDTPGIAALNEALETWE